MMEDCKEQLDGKTLSVALDGWSNVHKEPVVCVSVTTSDSDTHLTYTVDTSGNGHTAEYLTDNASTAITSCTQRFNGRSGASLHTMLQMWPK